MPSPTATPPDHEVIERLLTFYLPLQPDIHPDATSIQQQTLRWVRSFDLGQGDDMIHVMVSQVGAGLLSYCYPCATGELAQLLANYNAWAWVAQDRLAALTRTCEAMLAIGRWERIVRSPNSWPATTDALEAALADVFKRLRRCMTPVQWERFLAGQSQWVSALGWEVALRERGTALTLNDYLALRMGISGCYAAPAYLDAVQGIELDEKQLSHPRFRAAVDTAMMTAALDNDRYSYLRELDREGKDYNLFTALRNEYPDWSVAQVIDSGIAYRDRIMTRYLQLRAQLLRDANHDCRTYLEGIDLIVAGNMNFAAAAATRYNLPYHPVITDQPSDPRTELPPAATIAWWWDEHRP
ncbi:terpene synthase family protein [Nocardia sp. NPDC005745]|uniref:terpene synthase family protein n=1 Tax=Nocardia sp. NPDC005745 TaxID=3157061 RepID=UPI0033CF5773